MIYSFFQTSLFMTVTIGSVSARSSLSDRKQFPKPSTSRTTMETPRQPAPDNSRYNSNVEVKPEPVDSKVFFQVSSTGNRHFPVPRDRQRSIFPPSNDGNSQSSRDPRKRPSKWTPFINYRFFQVIYRIDSFFSRFIVSSIRNEIKLEAEEEGERLFFFFRLVHSSDFYMQNLVNGWRWSIDFIRLAIISYLYIAAFASGAFIGITLVWLRERKWG